MKRILTPILFFFISQTYSQTTGDILKVRFDKAFKKFGGRLEKPPVAFQGLCNLSLDLARRTISNIRDSNPGFPEVYIDIINSPLVNAISTSDRDGKYFIGINLGTLIILENVFYRLVSSKDVLCDIGDTAIEVNPKKVANLQALDLNEFFANIKEADFRVFPKDQKRMRLGNILLANAIESLVKHEYGHIVHGHIRYLNSTHTGYLLKEVADLEIKDSIVTNLFFQSMELDADAFAAFTGLKNIDRMIKKNEQLVSPDYREFFKDWQTYLRFWVFSNFTSFKIVGKKDSTSISFDSDHPPPSIRAFFMETIVSSILYEKIDTTKLNIIRTIIDARDEVDKGFSKISYLNYDLFESRFIVDSVSRRKFQTLIENFNNFYPIMQKYSYTDLMIFIKLVKPRENVRK